MMKEIVNCINLGQCGTRIGSLFERVGVESYYCNFDSIDFRGMEIDEDKMLILQGTGTGASFKKGLSLVEEFKEEFLEFIDNSLNKDKLNMFIFSLSGGSGSSMGVTAVDYAIEQGYKVGVLTVLPPKIQGLLAMDNAMKVMSILKDKKIDTFLLGDNDFMLDKIGIKKDWWSGVNVHIFNAVNAVFEILREDKNAVGGIGSIDKGELVRILQYGNGLCDIRVMYLNNYDLASEDDELKKLLYSPTMIEGYNYKDTLATIVNIDTPRNGDFSEAVSRIFNIVQKDTGSSVAKLGMFVDPTLAADIIRVTVINCGLKLPKAIKKGISELNRDTRKYVKKREKEEKTDFSVIETSAIDDDFDL